MAARQRLTARCLVYHRGLVLCVLHDGNRRNIGLPGGGVEPGETVEQAAARELHEETGLEAVELDPVSVIDEPKKRTVTFRCLASGWPRGSHEGSVAWATPAELLAGKHGDFYQIVLDAAGVPY